jgi:1-acyl-sn-glycerol-3-phosphate acyltransferase
MVIPVVLRRKYGVTQVQFRDEEKLRKLIDEGHGLLLAPNHCRMADALVLQQLAHQVRQPFYTMASAHLFRGSRTLAFLLRRLGAFSIYREGVDRKAVQTAIEILLEAKRPLVIFPEGTVSQANERLKALMDGVSFIARSAAKKLERRGGDDASPNKRKIYVVPVAIRYLFKGDIEQTVSPMLTEIEHRLSWRPQKELSLVERIHKVGLALLSLKEMEYLGQAQTGDYPERLARLIDHLLNPMEEEWLGEPREGSVIARIKELRKAILPEMIGTTLDQPERDRRWRQLKDIELAQQLSLYPTRYVSSNPTADRILETVERFAEHLSGDESPHPPMTAVVQVGDPIEVTSQRDRNAPEDPVLKQIGSSLMELIEELSAECIPYVANPPRSVDAQTPVGVDDVS